MYKLLGLARHLCRDTRGVSAIEYAVILAFSAVMATVGLTMLGGNLNNTLSTVSSYIGGAGVSDTEVSSTEDESDSSDGEDSSDFEDDDQSESDDSSSSSDGESSDDGSSDDGSSDS